MKITKTQHFRTITKEIQTQVLDYETTHFETSPVEVLCNSIAFLVKATWVVLLTTAKIWFLLTTAVIIPGCKLIWKELILPAGKLLLQVSYFSARITFEKILERKNQNLLK